MMVQKNCYEDYFNASEKIRHKHGSRITGIVTKSFCNSSGTNKDCNLQWVPFDSS